MNQAIIGAARKSIGSNCAESTHRLLTVTDVNNSKQQQATASHKQQRWPLGASFILSGFARTNQ
jgi:hypothetical protein